MIVGRKRLKLAGTKAEPVLCALYGIEQEGRAATMKLLHARAQALDAELTEAATYKAIYFLRSIRFVGDAPSKTLDQALAKLSVARREFAKVAGGGAASPRMAYRLTDMGRDAALFLMSQQQLIQELAGPKASAAKVHKLEDRVIPIRKRFYLGLLARFRGREAEGPDSAAERQEPALV